MVSLVNIVKTFAFEVLFTLRNTIVVIKYETKRYLISNRILILLVLCLVPTILYVSFAGQTASLEIHLHAQGYTWFVGHVLQIYVAFAYIINILVSIVVVQELFLHESALEALLVSTKRFEVFAGKTITALITLLLTSFFTWIGCILAFLTWQQGLPVTMEQFILAIILLMMVSLVPLAVTILGNTLVMKFRSLSGMGSGFPIFLFFVIPFFIFSSVYLGFANEQMLELSTFFRMYFLTNYFFMPEDERFATISNVNDGLSFFSGIILVSFVFGWVFFWRMEARQID